MPQIHTVFVQIESPSPHYGGRAVEGRYIIEDGEVILIDQHGNAVQDDTGKAYRQKMDGPGDNPKQIAGILTRKFQKALRGPSAGPEGFSRPIRYPKSWKKV